MGGRYQRAQGDGPEDGEHGGEGGGPLLRGFSPESALHGVPDSLLQRGAPGARPAGLDQAWLGRRATARRCRTIAQVLARAPVWRRLERGAARRHRAPRGWAPRGWAW